MIIKENIRVSFKVAKMLKFYLAQKKKKMLKDLN